MYFSTSVPPARYLLPLVVVIIVFALVVCTQRPSKVLVGIAWLVLAVLACFLDAGTHDALRAQHVVYKVAAEAIRDGPR